MKVYIVFKTVHFAERDIGYTLQDSYSVTAYGSELQAKKICKEYSYCGAFYLVREVK